MTYFGTPVIVDETDTRLIVACWHCLTTGWTPAIINPNRPRFLKEVRCPRCDGLGHYEIPKPVDYGSGRRKKDAL